MANENQPNRSESKDSEVTQSELQKPILFIQRYPGEPPDGGLEQGLQQDADIVIEALIGENGLVTITCSKNRFGNTGTLTLSPESAVKVVTRKPIRKIDVTVPRVPMSVRATPTNPINPPPAESQNPVTR